MSSEDFHDLWKWTFMIKNLSIIYIFFLIVIKKIIIVSEYKHKQTKSGIRWKLTSDMLGNFAIKTVTCNIK